MDRYRLYWAYPDGYQYTFAVISSQEQLVMAVELLLSAIDTPVVKTPDLSDVRASVVYSLGIVQPMSKAELFIELIRRVDLN